MSIDRALTKTDKDAIPTSDTVIPISPVSNNLRRPAFSINTVQIKVVEVAANSTKHVQYRAWVFASRP